MVEQKKLGINIPRNPDSARAPLLSLHVASPWALVQNCLSSCSEPSYSLDKSFFPTDSIIGEFRL